MLSYTLKEDGTLGLVEKPMPHASDDTAVVKIDAMSVCGTDFRTYKHGSNKIDRGRTIGHECCATIVELGKNIKDFSVGERVQIAPAIGCGECIPCKKGYTNMCDNLETIGFQFDGVFAEYMEVPAKAFQQGNVNKVAKSLLNEEIALAEPMACALNAQELCDVKEGDVVAIFGSGFIGCIHAELALATGASKVFMMEVSDYRLKEAKELIPEIRAVDSKVLDPCEVIMEETNGNGADVVIVACSVGALHTVAQKVAAKRGRISLFGGVPGEAIGYLDSNIIHYKELGVFGVHASTTVQNRRILKKIENGELKPSKYISKFYELRDIEQAFKDIDQGVVLKAVIRDK